MMHILTLKVGKKYSSQYVNKLYLSLKDNSTAPFKMYCYTDDPEGLIEDVEVIYNPFMKFLLQWNKVEFHSAEFGDIPQGEHCLIMDIDQIVIGDFDPILTHQLEEGQFGCMRRWWSRLQEDCPINGGFQMFRKGDTDHIWQKFNADSDFWQQYYLKNGLAFGKVNGEQNFIHQFAQENRHWFPKEWFGKYDSDQMEVIQKQWMDEVNTYEPFYLGDEFAESVKLVHFAASYNMMHKQNLYIVRKYWGAGEFDAKSYLRTHRK